MEYIEKCFGNCLEKAAIPDGCRVVYDTDIEPHIGDIVVCSDKYGSLTPFVKLVTALDGKGGGKVTTRYADRSKDFTFETPSIYGVVTKCLALESDDVVWHKEMAGV